MAEQLNLDGQVVHTEDLALGRAQRAVMEAWREHPDLTPDEAGAVIHAQRGNHTRDERCEWCGTDGAAILASLTRRGLLDGGAVSQSAAPPSSGPASSSSSGLTARTRSSPSEPDAPYDPETAAIPF